MACDVILRARVPEGPFIRGGCSCREHALVALETVTEGQGPPVVMLGRETEGAAAFAPHAAGLAKDFRLVRPNPYGSCGQGASSRCRRATRSKPRVRAGASLDMLGIREPVNLVGHSFGALVALDFALDHPIVSGHWCSLSRRRSGWCRARNSFPMRRCEVWSNAQTFGAGGRAHRPAGCPAPGPVSDKQGSRSRL